MSTSATKRVLFRWSLWQPTPESVFMLSHSIGTVRAFFGDSADYVVFTDKARLLEAKLLVPATVRDYFGSLSRQFCDPRSTWLKWAPRGRLDVRQTEVYLDADVFLVDEPDELRRFCGASSPHRFLAAQEEFSADWPYGTFRTQLPPSFTPINAGIVGQRAGADFSTDLISLYEAWNSRANGEGFLYHDEQGAVAMALQTHCQRDEVMLLDPDRYRVVCPLNDPPVDCLAGITALHATYPEHPAFWRFLPEIAAVSGVNQPLSIVAKDFTLDQ